MLFHGLKALGECFFHRIRFIPTAF